MDLRLEYQRVENAFLAMGALYSLLFAICLVQFIRLSSSYYHWTSQKYIHFLVLLICACRSVAMYLIGGAHWCHIIENGTLSPACSMLEREMFYILDQTPTLFYFTLCTMVVYFWADIYCYATDQVEYLQSTVKKTCFYANILVYVLQIVLWVSYLTRFTAEKRYVTRVFACYNTACFFVMAIAFVYYGRGAYLELKAVPLDLSLRIQRLNQVAQVTSTLTICFTLRSFVLLWMSYQKVQLHDYLSWAVVVVYFAAFEIVPCMVLLYFYRHMPRSQSSNNRRAKNSIAQPLIPKAEGP